MTTYIDDGLLKNIEFTKYQNIFTFYDKDRENHIFSLKYEIILYGLKNIYDAILLNDFKDNAGIRCTTTSSGLVYRLDIGLNTNQIFEKYHILVKCINDTYSFSINHKHYFTIKNPNNILDAIIRIVT